MEKRKEANNENIEKIILKSSEKIDAETLKNHIEEYLWDDINDHILKNIFMAHLIIEEIFDSLIRKTNFASNPNTFSYKNKLLFDTGKIDKNLYTILCEINQIRNNYAHNYLYQVKNEELYNLIALANKYNIYYDEDAYAEKSKYKDESNESLVFNFLYNLTLKMSELYL
jgi:hypothetical protein